MWRSACTAALLVAALHAAPLVNAQVLIDPVVVELGAKQRSAALTLTLSPKAAGPMLLQSEVLQWAQDVNGEGQFKPTNDLLVVPPIVELKPGESQLIRVAFRGQRTGTVEQAYRLLIEDAGKAGAQGGNAGISFRMRYDLPVMLGATEPPRQSVQWSSCESSDPATVCVRMANQGTRRVTLKQLAMAGVGWKLDVEQPGTVLAQGVREWRLPRPAGNAGPVVTVAAETTRSENVGARLATP